MGNEKTWEMIYNGWSQKIASSIQWVMTVNGEWNIMMNDSQWWQYWMIIGNGD